MNEHHRVKLDMDILSRPLKELIWHKPTFSELLLQGNFIKEIIKRILEESGYLVFPLGYESFLTQLKHIIHEKSISSDIARKIATFPDLIVYDLEKDIKLVEIKSKNWDPASNELIPIDFPLDALKKEWKNAILVLVIPYRHWFYAQEIETLNLYEEDSEKGIKLSDLELFENIFLKTTTDALYRYKEIVAKVFGIFGTNRYSENYFPENKEINDNLLEFIHRNPNLIDNKEELFRKYNTVNLISREKFEKNYGNLKKNNKI
jgi:hypothetical protein